MTVIIAGSPRKGMYSDRLAEAYKEMYLHLLDN